MAEYIAEAMHWYRQDGSPCHTQVVASGGRKGLERPTTLRDARKLGLVPSVTSLLSILDKPALTHWKIRRAVEKALDPFNFVEDTSAEEGSRIHGIVEKWIEDGKDPPAKADFPYVDVVDSVFHKLGIKAPCSERSFCADDFAGCVDLHDRKANIIIDFKTKDLSLDDMTKGKKLHYDEHAMQLGAYRHGLGMHSARCFNLFLSRTEPEAYVLHEWNEAEIQRGWRMFSLCKNLWKETKQYDPMDAGDKEKSNG